MEKQRNSPRFTIRMSLELHRWLKGYARRKDMSMSQVVKEYLQSLRRQDERANPRRPQQEAQS